ncbi:MAG: GTPase HflX [Eubacteriales bacterium]|nr:GTPase HflX [Eubacteriales bacterium]MDD3350307.1 GTPase HflX [Eubacteriales bacterium]
MLRFNDNNETIEQESYRAILAGLSINEDITYYMEELEGLAEAAGVEVLGQMIQAKDRPDSATYFGKGKVEELGELCVAMDADTVIFNNELTGVQLRNLEDRLEVRVIDRTMLILDIFAARAVSREGNLQVELAQLEYRLPRLTGFGKSLSRLGGGIGTRGPGEKKLETDRRHIRKRMDDIRAEIEEVKAHRKTQRAQRENSGLPMVALVGYTNSGKSALMNRFLQETMKDEKTVQEKDMLFATLDTAHRLIRLDSNDEFLLIDTVGFVSRLPHSLVKAFKATLEEVNFADLLLQVIDVSLPNNEFHIDVTDRVLAEIGAGDKEKMLVYNKVDLVPELDRVQYTGKDAIFLSAKTGENIETLITAIKEKIFGGRVKASLLIPYDRGEVLSAIRDKYRPQNVEYKEEGSLVEVELSADDFRRWERYLSPQSEAGSGKE